MTTLSTSRTVANSPGEHVADHNLLHDWASSAIFFGGARMSVGGSGGAWASASPNTSFPILNNGFDGVISTPFILFPPGWTRVKVSVLWNITGGTVADIYLTPAHQALSDGQAAAGATNATPQAWTNASTGGVVNRDTLFESMEVTPLTVSYRWFMTRHGADSLDTSTQAVNIIGFVVENLSALPSNRNIGNTGRQHIDDHNTLHEFYNDRLIVVGGDRITPDGVNCTNTAGDGPVYADAATGQGNFSVRFPTDWNTCKISVIGLTGGAGNVRWNLLQNILDDDESILAATTLATVTVSYTGNIWSVDQLVASHTIDNTAQSFFYLQRLGADGADTLAATVSVYAIMFERLT